MRSTPTGSTIKWWAGPRGTDPYDIKTLKHMHELPGDAAKDVAWKAAELLYGQEPTLVRNLEHKINGACSSWLPGLAATPWHGVCVEQSQGSGVLSV